MCSGAGQQFVMVQVIVWHLKGNELLDGCLFFLVLASVTLVHFDLPTLPCQMTLVNGATECGIVGHCTLGISVEKHFGALLVDLSKWVVVG